MMVPLAILISEGPRIILSSGYVTYNDPFTFMLLPEELSGFAHEGRTLQITSARGQQRSTYWFQLPYCYGITLFVVSSVVHWLLSQSIFVAILLFLFYRSLS